jgi:hypothetical protein
VCAFVCCLNRVYVSAMRCWPSAELLLWLFAALLNCYCCCLLLQELRDSCNFVMFVRTVELHAYDTKLQHIIVFCMSNLPSVLLDVRFLPCTLKRRLSSSSSRQCLTARLVLSAFLNLGFLP